MKFHCYVKELPLRAQADSQLAWLVVQRGIEYLSHLVKTRVQGACRRCHHHTRCCLCWLINKFVQQSLFCAARSLSLYRDNDRFAAWYVIGSSAPLQGPTPVFSILGLCLLLTGVHTSCLLPKRETWAHHNLRS